MTGYPAFDEFDYRDFDDGDGSLDPFSWCVHALAALRAGDVATALETLIGRASKGDLADKIAGEAESLIRDGFLFDAERRLECAAEPKFNSIADARKAYRKTRIAQRRLDLGRAA